MNELTDLTMELLELYKKTLLIRLFEEKVDWLFSRGKLGGTTHLCIGQEAVAVGVISRLNPQDYVVSTHRGHGHLIAKGADLKKLFAELLGRKQGYCKGKGGTQHLSVMEKNFLGTNGITGGGIPIATGAGLSIKLREEDRIAVCFFGDGASNQGTFHESMNIASVWRLPVLYVCENNLYAMSTSFSRVSRFDDVARRAHSYGIESRVVDGMDITAVAGESKEAVEMVRGGGGPFLLEAKTYRYCGHSKSDPRSYRTKEEEKWWKDKDPLKKMEGLLLKDISGDELEGIRREVNSSVEDAYEFAQSGTTELTMNDALEGVYAHKKDLIPQGYI